MTRGANRIRADQSHPEIADYVKRMPNVYDAHGALILKEKTLTLNLIDSSSLLKHRIPLCKHLSQLELCSFSFNLAALRGRYGPERGR